LLSKLVRSPRRCGSVPLLLRGNVSQERNVSSDVFIRISRLPDLADLCRIEDFEWKDKRVISDIAGNYLRTVPSIILYQNWDN